MAYRTQSQLDVMGFKFLGRAVMISDKASIYNPGAIEIGDHSRIDDFCILSAGAEGVRIGRYVHIASYCSLIGAAKIELKDFSGLSSRVSIYSSSDDYSGSRMTNPTVPRQFTGVKNSPVVIGRHVIVGAGCVILPGVTMHDGSGAGALSLIKRDCESFGMYIGVPARRVGHRSRKILELEKELDNGEGA